MTSPARSAVEAALSAVAQAQVATPADGATAASSAAAQDAIGMVQAALDRRDAAAAELSAILPEDPAVAVSAADDSPSGGDAPEVDQEESTKEPESARWSRNNPAASHSHMAHLLW